LSGIGGVKKRRIEAVGNGGLAFFGARARAESNGGVRGTRTFSPRLFVPRERVGLRVHPELEHALPRGLLHDVAVIVPKREGEGQRGARGKRAARLGVSNEKSTRFGRSRGTPGASTNLSYGSFSGSTMFAWSPSLFASCFRHKLSERAACRNVAHVASALAKSGSPRNPNTSRSTCAGTLSSSMLGCSSLMITSHDKDRNIRPSASRFHPVRALIARVGGAARVIVRTRARGAGRLLPKSAKQKEIARENKIIQTKTRSKIVPTKRFGIFFG
jgi:hypothetical protein